MTTPPQQAFPVATPEPETHRLSDKFADAVTSGMGSWKFVGGQAVVLAAWITINTTTITPIPHFDPNLILLNLALSTEAAFAGAFILMSQNRRADKDREMMENDYHVDVTAERSIQEMNRKLDALLAAIPPEQLKTILAGIPATQPVTQTFIPAPQAASVNDNADAAKAVKRVVTPAPR